MELEASAFTRVMRPQGVALPMISMAVRIQLDQQDSISGVRISLGPAGPVPFLAQVAMDQLTGQQAEPQNYSNTVETVLQSVSLRSSQYRASREYREEMIRSHLPLILMRAAERARSGRAVPEGVGQ
jgi:carbon-monoxide dehydrogenase medium subunit